MQRGWLCIRVYTYGQHRFLSVTSCCFLRAKLAPLYRNVKPERIADGGGYPETATIVKTGGVDKQGQKPSSRVYVTSRRPFQVVKWECSSLNPDTYVQKEKPGPRRTQVVHACVRVVACVCLLFSLFLSDLLLSILTRSWGYLHAFSVGLLCFTPQSLLFASSAYELPCFLLSRLLG